MSDRIRKGAGAGLVLISLLLCTMPLLQQQDEPGDRFAAGGKTAVPVTDTATESNGPVAVNTAGAEEMTVLPGIGKTLSRLIVEERTEHGPYYYAEDLETVRGIGPSTLKGIRDLIDLAQKESGE